MSGHPRLPLHVGDYLKDTPPVSRVSWEHHGIYMLALMIAWNTPRCQLPNDPTWLAMRFGCSVEDYQTHVEPVLKTYFKCDGNFYKQKRLRHEHDYIKKQGRIQSERAKSRKRKQTEASRKDDPAQPESQSGSAPTPTPTPTPTYKKEASSDEDASAREFEDWYRQYPRHVGKSAAAKAYRAARKTVGERDLTAATMRYAASVSETEARFIAHPATWLNGQRWLDEPDPPPKPSEAQRTEASIMRTLNGGGNGHAAGDGAAVLYHPNAARLRGPEDRGRQ